MIFVYNSKKMICRTYKVYFFDIASKTSKNAKKLPAGFTTGGQLKCKSIFDDKPQLFSCPEHFKCRLHFLEGDHLADKAFDVQILNGL